MSKNVTQWKRMIRKVSVLTVAGLGLLTVNPLVSQSIPTEKDLFVSPPSYAKYDSGQTQFLTDFFKSMNQQVTQNMEASMGFKVVMKSYVFVCERSIDEVASYYSDKLEIPAEIEIHPIFDSPEELEEEENESGVGYPEDFMDRYRAAYEKYGDLEQESVEFDTGDMDYLKGGTSVTIEIENPGVDYKTLSPIQKTVITYTVVKFSK